MSFEYQPAQAPRITKQGAILMGVRGTGLALMVVAAFPTAVAVWEFWSTSVLLRTGVKTTGTVVAVKDADAGKGGIYRTVFRFKDSAGQSHEVTNGSIGSSTTPIAVGEVVPVVYDPLNPGHARIGGFLHHWSVVVVLGVIAGLYVGFGFLVMRLGPVVVRRFWPEGSAVTPKA